MAYPGLEILTLCLQEIMNMFNCNIEATRKNEKTNVRTEENLQDKNNKNKLYIFFS